MNINFINSPTIGLKSILIKNSPSVPSLSFLEIFSETIKEPVYHRVNTMMIIVSFMACCFKNKK
ncbi:MAG: hypothetical protein CVU00_07625 [Bacteroidetes bacterium HGW-Bacteroidetes-17]|nr:MAG: hypothetical protein CVU00_07625 [Bacteroidetes bacterium HGW-Bacteroidetes-17]